MDNRNAVPRRYPHGRRSGWDRRMHEKNRDSEHRFNKRREEPVRREPEERREKPAQD